MRPPAAATRIVSDTTGSRRTASPGWGTRAVGWYRSAVAADDDGAGVRQRVPGGYSPAPSLLQPVLARPRHHLGCDFHRGVFDGDSAMSHFEPTSDLHHT